MRGDGASQGGERWYRRFVGGLAMSGIADGDALVGKRIVEAVAL